MLKQNRLALCKTSNISWFDFIVLILLITGGVLYLHNPMHWGIAWIGDSQYGDAEFWWNGANHVAQGFFQTNPGNGYRPGYFFLTGILIAILGDQFQHFYPYFLLFFLFSSYLFYLALRHLLGRWVAACVVGTLIFNPYTAEWIATSTTDATGLLLNIFALICLIYGVQQRLNRGWLMGFAFLFSLATLTRPLVTPFIAIILVFLCFFAKETLKKRISITLCVLIAFCIPTFLWMSVQKFTISQWSISSNDASAFYAASDPTIQVWNTAMYADIQKIAAQRYHVKVSDVNDKMLNHVFWQETVKNYVKHPSYHFKRVLPSFLKVIAFNPAHAARGSLHWRIGLFEAMIICFSIGLFTRRQQFQGYLFVALGILILIFPKTLTFMVLVGAFLSLNVNDKKSQPGMMLLGLYWFTGVFSLYLVEGTYGSISFSRTFAFNSLGYRLGSQFFFMNDVIAAYFLICLAKSKLPLLSSFKRLQSFITQPTPLANNIVTRVFNILFSLTLLTYLVGSSIVGYRIFARYEVPKVSYPPLVPLMKGYKQRTGKDLLEATAQNGSIDPSIFSMAKVKNHQSDIVFTGTTTSFIWKLAGQKRTQLMVFAQNYASPNTMGPGHQFIEVPQRLQSTDWVDKKGAFIIHNEPDDHNNSNLPYYLTVPGLRAFIPLSQNQQRFEWEAAVWFPLVKNATQLETSKELKATNAIINWALDSGKAPFKRRFFLAPTSETSVQNPMKLYIDTSAAEGDTTLQFAYTIGEKENVQLPQAIAYNLNVTGVKENIRDMLFSIENKLPNQRNFNALNKVNISVPPGTKTLEITFDNLFGNRGVWIYEFNLSAADFIYPALNQTNKRIF